MRFTFFLILFILFLNESKSQKVSFGIAYQNLNYFEMDKAVQAYNFTRPFIENKQDFLMNGIEGFVSYWFSSTNKIKHGIALNYSYFNSTSSNENLINSLNQHFIKPAYCIHFRKNENLEGFFADLKIAAILGGLFRNINQTPYIVDETKINALGIGGEIELKIGYLIKISNSKSIAPYLGSSFSPYYYSPNMETIVNQTNGLITKNWSSLYSINIGFSLFIE